MLKSCAQIAGLSSQATDSKKYLTSQVFFRPSLSTASRLVPGLSPQADPNVFNPFIRLLCPQSTAPINTTGLTNLRKDVL
jgi:hypothetical protein